MHFKPFWMPCLHIKFFTSAPIPELTAVENFTKRWNGMLGSLSDFKNQFKSRKVLIRLDRNPSIRNEEKKVLIGSEFMFQEGAKLSKYRFFMLLLLRILVRNKTYMLSDWIFLKNILIGQISSHRCRRLLRNVMRTTAVKNEFLKRKYGVLLKIVLSKCYPNWIAVSKTKTG